MIPVVVGSNPISHPNFRCCRTATERFLATLCRHAARLQAPRLDSLMTELELSIRDRVATIVLNRPEKANSLNSSVVEALHVALDQAFDVPLRLLVLRAVGRNFCAGFDFSGFEAMTVAELGWRFIRIEQLLQRLTHAPCPTMVLAQGACYGAGADLVIACEMRLAAPDARFRMPGWRFGLALGTRRLAWRIGDAPAMRMLESATVLDASAAAAAGLIIEVCLPDTWDARCIEAKSRAESLDDDASLRLRRILTPDTQAADIASLVESLTSGDLKARIGAFRQQSKAA